MPTLSSLPVVMLLLLAVLAVVSFYAGRRSAKPVPVLVGVAPANSKLPAFLGSSYWLESVAPALHKQFPEDWTHSADLDWSHVQDSLDLYGLPAKTENETVLTVNYLAQLGIVETSEHGHIRRAQTLPVLP